MYSSSPVARLLLIVGMVVGATILSAQPALAQPGWVLSHQKISDWFGGFTGILDDFDFFGRSVASLGDLDGDGNIGPFDLANILNCWGPVEPKCELFDANGDGSIGPFDLASLLNVWGPCE